MYHASLIIETDDCVRAW